MRARASRALAIRSSLVIGLILLLGSPFRFDVLGQLTHRLDALGDFLVVASRHWTSRPLRARSFRRVCGRLPRPQASSSSVSPRFAISFWRFSSIMRSISSRMPSLGLLIALLVLLFLDHLLEIVHGLVDQLVDIGLGFTHFQASSIRVRWPADADWCL